MQQSDYFWTHFMDELVETLKIIYSMVGMSGNFQSDAKSMKPFWEAINVSQVLICPLNCYEVFSFWFYFSFLLKEHSEETNTGPWNWVSFKSGPLKPEGVFRFYSTVAPCRGDNCQTNKWVRSDDPHSPKSSYFPHKNYSCVEWFWEN